MGPRSAACRATALGLLLAVSACAPAESEDSTVIVRIEGAPTQAPAPDRVAVAMPAGALPTVLSSVHGAVAVGTATDLWAGSLADTSLQKVPLIAEQGEPETTGAIVQIARRSGGRIFVLGENGLFHDDVGVLLASPLNTDPALAGKALMSIDALGSDEGEELWIATAGGAFHVAGGKMAAFGITDAAGADAPVDAAIGVAPGKALVISGDRAFFVDLKATTATSVVSGLGKVNDYDKAEDGTVYLATDTGLWTREKTKGAVTLRTLAPAGAPPVQVLSVAASFGTVIAATASDLIQIDGEEAKRIDDLATIPHGLAVDGNGDAWAVDTGELFHLKTGAPVSFVNDVSPFFDSHCSHCHATGANGSPPIDLLDYDIATELAPTIMKRLQGEISVMPPASSEVLTAADYAVVTRWIAGGLLP